MAEELFCHPMVEIGHRHPLPVRLPTASRTSTTSTRTTLRARIPTATDAARSRPKKCEIAGRGLFRGFVSRSNLPETEASDERRVPATMKQAYPWGALSVLVIWTTSCGDSPTSPPTGSSATTTTTTAPAPTTSTSSTTTTSVAPSSQVVRQATFESANGYATRGSARIVRTGSSHALELGSDFQASQSPALDVRLCNDTNCRSMNLNLGDLQRFSGSQTYSLPNDGAAYDRVVIYCRAVQLAFGFGLLR